MYKRRQLTHKLNKFRSLYIHGFLKTQCLILIISYSWTSSLFSTLNTNNSWWIIFFIFLRRNATKKVVRPTEILIYKFLSNDVE